MTELTTFLDPALLALWLVVFAAAWLQTLTGFAFGLIFMGGVGLFHLIPLPEAAVLSGLLTVFNGALVIGREHKSVDGPALKLFLIGSVPGLMVGYALLLWLAGSAVAALQLALGLIILGASLQMMRRPAVRTARSATFSFLTTGFMGGVMGGMFSTAGPPVIWQMYRQPLSHAAIRATLLSIFVLNGILRLVFVMALTGIAFSTLAALAGALPVAMLATFIARRIPPPLSPNAMRRLALSLLFLSGLALSLPVISSLMKAYI